MVYPELTIHIDLAELRGFSYHTGILFTLYNNTGMDLARGGRYDAIGEAFGQARPATGFSGDLISLSLAHRPDISPIDAAMSGIWVNAEDASDSAQQVSQLRSQGERVVSALSGSLLQPGDCQCDRQLVRRGEQWVTKAL